MDVVDETINVRKCTTSSTTSATCTYHQDHLALPMIPCSLFGWRTTNFFESDNNTVLVHGVRDASPFEVLKIMTQTTMEFFCMRKDQIKQWRTKKLTVSPRARSL